MQDLLGYNTVLLGEWFPTFQRIVVPSNQGDVNTQDQTEKFHGGPILRKERKELNEWNEWCGAIISRAMESTSWTPWPWRWRDRIPSKCQEPLTLHSVTLHKARILSNYILNYLKKLTFTGRPQNNTLMLNVGRHANKLAIAAAHTWWTLGDRLANKLAIAAAYTWRTLGDRLANKLINAATYTWQTLGDRLANKFAIAATYTCQTSADRLANKLANAATYTCFITITYSMSRLIKVWFQLEK
jgi:hypothetical protein